MLNCPGCGFGNFDHVVKCVKCGVPLHAQEVLTVDPNPPRARGRRRFLQTCYRMRRKRGFQWREDGWGDKPEHDSFHWTQFLAFLLPGFYQLIYDRKSLGFFCIAAVAGGVSSAFLLYGTVFFFLAVLLAAAGYCISLYDTFGGPFFRNLLRPSILTPVGGSGGSAREKALLIPDMLFPSFYQFRTRRYVRGAIFLLLVLGGWVLFFNGDIYLYSTLIALGHTLAVCDQFNFANYSLGVRVGYTLVLSFFLFQALNFFYFRGLQDVVLPRDVIILSQAFQGPELQAGDWVFLNSEAKDFQAGDIVRVQFIERFVYGADDFIDRILAAPGDSVRIEKNKLYINGTLSPHRPLNLEYQLPDSDEFHLGGDQFFIFPSVAVPNGQWNIQWTRITRSRILSRVERIILPLWRRRVLVKLPAEEYIEQKEPAIQEQHGAI